MYSPNDCFAQTPALRIRPVPELGRCMVFTPERPSLYTLNPAAWLVLELCDGRSLSALESAYLEAVGGADDASAAGSELRATLEDFERKGIVVRKATALAAHPTPRDQEDQS